MQRTLIGAVGFTGTGLHSGRPVRLTLHPAPVGHGVVFHRTDLPDVDPLPARWDHVEQTALCTRLVGADGASVSTIEHLMAAIAGLGLSNLRIDIDGPEVPILDGSSAAFVRGLLSRGAVGQEAPAPVLEVLKPVVVREGAAEARLDPADGLIIDFRIDFEDAAIGRQSLALNMRNGAFVRHLCDSRTFCRQADVDAMHEAGLALGGTYTNAVVFDGDKVLSPGGLRHDDEPVRHKMLDALGDLALAGGPILGRYTGIRAGHALTNRLLRKLFSDRSAFRWTDCNDTLGLRLPGVGVGRADLALVA